MASREEMALLRDARSGHADAQVELAKRYLVGSRSLPRSVETGMYWLARAARQGAGVACAMIGTHIPLEVALRMQECTELVAWYERAYDDGVLQAGLALAKLVLSERNAVYEPRLHHKAWTALERAAESDIPEAQRLLLQLLEDQVSAVNPPGLLTHCSKESTQERQRYLDWVKRAACNGVEYAQRRLADLAWDASDDRMFLDCALPIARGLVRDLSDVHASDHNFPVDDIALLSHCARALIRAGDFATDTMKEIAEPAAREGDRYARFCLGLWYAKMNEKGERLPGIARLINYRMAIYWLTLSGKQGIADAWFVISRIYLRPEFSHRSITEAEKNLFYAARAGHCGAQLALGQRLWRQRRRGILYDVKAADWLHRASAQGCPEAAKLLSKIASSASPALWALALAGDAMAIADPLLAARIKLAAHFGLSKQEALLLDVCAADHGHCLLVDIQGKPFRGRRRLILIKTGAERRVLDQVKRVFERATRERQEDEGNYRQRLYRLGNASGSVSSSGLCTPI